MSQLFCINLTYDEPYDDFMLHLVNYPDTNVVDIRLSLTLYRNFLADNLNKLDKLLESAQHIKKFVINEDSNKIIIEANEDHVKDLVIAKVLKKYQEHSDDERTYMTDDEYSVDSEYSDEETNYERMTHINNLTNQYNLNICDNKDSDTESDNSDIVDDETARQNIVDKYRILLESYCSDRSDYTHNNDYSDTNSDAYTNTYTESYSENEDNIASDIEHDTDLDIELVPNQNANSDTNTNENSNASSDTDANINSDDNSNDNSDNDSDDDSDSD